MACVGQAGEGGGGGDVGPVANHLEGRGGTDGEGLEAGELRETAGSRDPGWRSRARSHPVDRPRDRRDVLGGRPATAADDVHEAARGELAKIFGGVIRALVVLTERAGQARIRIAADVEVVEPRKPRQV